MNINFGSLYFVPNYYKLKNDEKKYVNNLVNEKAKQEAVNPEDEKVWDIKLNNGKDKLYLSGSEWRDYYTQISSPESNLDNNRKQIDNDFIAQAKKINISIES